MHVKTLKNIFATASIGVLITACGGGGSSFTPAVPTIPAPQPDPIPMRMFEVSVVNLTAGQPFSPIALVAHDSTYSAFDIGAAATTGLEELAEGGDNTSFLDEATSSDAVITTVSASGVLPPGATEMMMLEVSDDVVGAYLSGVTMLVNTNDAITGFRGVDIAAMEVGDSVRMTTIGYDAGTEANTEAAGTIPGPADGGEGFNEARDDLSDIVRGHPGVLSQDDGLASSVLTEAHRWDNPIARVTISRVE